MTDIFESEGIQPPSLPALPELSDAKEGAGADIFANEGIGAPSISERNISAGNAGVNLQSPRDDNEKQIVNNLKDDMAQTEALAATRFTPERMAEFKQNPIGFWDSFHLVIPGYTAAKGALDTYNVYDIGKKYEAGEALSQEEQNTLNQFIDNHLEEQLRGRTIMGNVAYVLSEMPAFAVEFALSGGAGKAAQVAAVKGAEKYVTTKVVSKVAGTAANVAARSAVFAPRVVEGYAERRVADNMTITDKGDLVLKESQESPAKSALMAYSYTAAEVASEMAGAKIGKYFIDPIKGVLKTPLTAAVNNLPVGLKNAMYQAYKKIQPNAQVSKVFTAAGWNGMLEEMGEERVAALMNGFIGVAGNDQQAAADGKKFTANDYFNTITPTGDQLLVEAGVISIAGGVKTSADMGFNLLRNRGMDEADAHETMENLSAIEQDQLVDKLVTAPQSSFSMPQQEATKELRVKIAPLYDEAAVSISPAQFRDRAKQIDLGGPVGAPPIMTDTQADKFYASTKGGYYDVPQNLDTDLYADGSLEDETYTDNSAMNASPEIVLYDAATQKIQDQEPPPINHDESMSDTFIRGVRNELWPIHKLGDMAKKNGLDVEGFKTKKFNPAELATRMYSSVLTQTQWAINHNTFYYDQDGNAVNTGKALKPILDDFDNYFIEHEGSAPTRRKDFTDYLIAQRYLQDLAGREDVLVTEEQRAESIAALARLTEKYGAHFEMFNTFAQELYEYQKNMLQRLVASGNMSEKKLNEIVKKNPNYIPFKRVIDEEKLMSVTQGNPVFSNARASAVIKTIHGSEADIKDPLTSIILNTARITDLALRNEAARQIANYAAIMPEYVQKVEPSMIKTGKAKVKVTYDKRLRERLTKAIEFFGNEFEQKKSLQRPGLKGYIRGEYNAQEKLVRMRLGASDAVLAHEVGHMLDFSLGLDESLLKQKGVKAELLALAEERLASDVILKNDDGKPILEDVRRDIESDKHKEYVRNDREIVANFFDAYVNAPDLLDRIAPKAKVAFEKIIDGREDLAFIRDIKPSLERGEETVEQDVWGPSPHAPQGSVIVFRNGEREFYKVSKPIFEAAQNLSPSQLNLFEKIFIAPASTVFKMGATLTPEFMLRSIPREGLTALILNRDVKFNPSNYMRGFLAVVKNAVGGESDLYKEFSRSARFSNYMELSEDSVQKHFSALVSGKGRVMQYAKNPMKVLEEVGMGIDQIARVGAYDAAKRAGFSDYEAALVSRDVFDYSRSGSTTRGLNTYIPFLRAGVNGSDKLYRAVKNRPVETAFWALMTVTLPSIALASYYLYYAPDEDRKEYLEIPENLRSVFWFYKDNGEWKKIPKPFQIGYLFGTMPEMAMVWMADENRPEGQKMAAKVISGLAESASPVADWSSIIPLVVKVPMEWASNYNFFFGKDIYPSFLDGKDPALRSSPWTSETAKLIGEKFEVSPAKVDNAMRGLLAGSSQYVTGGGDWLINQFKEFNGETVPAKPITPSDIMVIRALAQRRPSGYRSNSYQTFSDRYEQVKQRHGSLKDMEGDERAVYSEKHRGELTVYGSMSAAKKQISGIGKELTAIYENKQMDSQEKVDHINRLEDRITEIAREANRNYNAVTRGSR